MAEWKEPVSKDNVYIAPGAVVCGDVTLHEDVSVWFHAVVRAEEGTITVGRGSNIQDGCVVHVDKGGAVTIGKQVTIGHNAVIHGCARGRQHACRHGRHHHERRRHWEELHRCGRGLGYRAYRYSR